MRSMQDCERYEDAFCPDRYAEDWLNVLRHGSDGFDFSYGALSFFDKAIKSRLFEDVYRPIRGRYELIERLRDCLKCSSNPEVQKSALRELNDELYHVVPVESESNGIGGVYCSNGEIWSGICKSLDYVYGLAYLHRWHCDGKTNFCRK